MTLEELAKALFVQAGATAPGHWRELSDAWEDLRYHAGRGHQAAKAVVNAYINRANEVQMILEERPPKTRVTGVKDDKGLQHFDIQKARAQ